MANRSVVDVAEALMWATAAWARVSHAKVLGLELPPGAERVGVPG